MSQFYRVLVDPNATNRWYPKAPVDSNGQDIDPRIFTSCVKYNGETPLRLPLRCEGEPVNFNFCDFDMIVTSKYLNDQIQELVGNSIQRIPVWIETSDEPYEILNILDSVECINETKSVFTKWMKDTDRTDRVGQFRMITKLVIDSRKAQDHKIFRINNWKIALIIDNDVKELLENNNVTGVVFQSVS